MRALLQRVSRAGVEVDGSLVGSIDQGLLIFLGVSKEDVVRDADYLAGKIVSLRIFPDRQGMMNRNISEAGGAILVVSQFTLYGDCRKGRRPGFDAAAAPAEALQLYNYFVGKVANYGIPVSTGVFQAHMKVSLTNDGPVTFLLESKKFELE